jgi:hypothetical protein
MLLYLPYWKRPNSKKMHVCARIVYELQNVLTPTRLNAVGRKAAINQFDCYIGGRKGTDHSCILLLPPLCSHHPCRRSHHPPSPTTPAVAPTPLHTAIRPFASSCRRSSRLCMMVAGRSVRRACESCTFHSGLFCSLSSAFITFY